MDNQISMQWIALEILQQALEQGKFITIDIKKNDHSTLGNITKNNDEGMFITIANSKEAVGLDASAESIRAWDKEINIEEDEEEDIDF